MYRRPEWLDNRITDEQYEKLMDIANSEYESALSFGSFFDHFERAILSAATLMLPPKTKCKSADKYKGKRKPTCNNGKPCDTCLEKYKTLNDKE